MRARIAISISALCLYLATFNFYIFELTRIDWHYANLIYNYLTAGAILFFLLDLKSGFVNNYHEQINLILILCVLMNYAIIILLRHGVLKDDKPIYIFYAFNGSVLAITATIFYCGWKYKTFKD